MQVAGPYDIHGAIRRALPKTLKILKGETLDVDWYLQDELPVTPPNEKGEPLPNPHGVFRILPPVTQLNAVASKTDERLDLVTKADTIPFDADTLTYEVTEQDIAAVTSVIGTLAGAPNHAFVPGTDYSFTRKAVTWTGTGDLPDDATNVAYTYQHRMYVERYEMDSRITVRAILKCKAIETDARHYPGSTLAAVLGNSLEMRMRRMSGDRLVRPDSTDEPYTETASIGRVLSAGPLPPDKSGTLFPWFVDFTLYLRGVDEGDAVRAILEAPLDATIAT